ncbi:hypothetical protein NB716_002552 [Pantoea ananatis]|nr:hypothetical protein [Pantoea ananatis]
MKTEQPLWGRGVTLSCRDEYHAGNKHSRSVGLALSSPA